MPSALPAQVREICVLDESDPEAIVNLVTDKVKEAIIKHSFEKPELFDKGEHELIKFLRTSNTQPSPLDNRLRLKFWTEYDRVMGQGLRSMSMANVLSGLCSKELFYGKYLQRPEKVAWLLCPPTGYMAKAEEALEFGLEQLRDILALDHVLPSGKVDTKLGELKAKIVAMLDARVKGAVVQRSMNVNVNTSNEAVAKAAQAASMEDLERQLKELRRRDRASRNVVEVQAEVEPE